MTHSEEKKKSPAEWFTGLVVSGAAKVIRKVTFWLYSILLIGLICLIVGVSIFALLALTASAAGPVVAMILGALICCALLLGPVPNWIKSLVVSLHEEFMIKPAV